MLEVCLVHVRMSAGLRYGLLRTDAGRPACVPKMGDADGGSLAWDERLQPGDGCSAPSIARGQ